MASSTTTLTTFGPAGIPFDIRESGANILNNFCSAFPDTEVNTMIPEFFGDNITELMDPKPNLSRKQQDSVHGRTINQVGEGHELVVFNLFVRMIRQKDISPTILIMRTFEMDTKNQLNLKRRALLSLLPNIKFKSVNTNAENDFVILVKDHGIVFVEVKGSKKESMVRSAEKQLHNVNGIVQRITKAITEDEDRHIPTVKLIVIPDETDETPTDPTPQGSYFVFKDACDKFDETWQVFIDKLRLLKSKNPFTPTEFAELSQILVGIWSAKVVSVIGSPAYGLKQEETNIARVKQLEKIDEVVDTANVRNEDHFKYQEDKVNPLTRIERTKESDIFRSCSDLKLCYLTPDQKRIFSCYKQVLLRGCAGCGKSLLVLFKVLELLNNPSTTISFLLLGPTPHTLRIKNALCANNVPVELIDQFPPPPSSKNVFVMDLEKFFNVECTTLMSYDMSNYHIFIDDLQNMNYYGDYNDDEDEDEENENSTTFFDVRDFIEQTHDICLRNDTFFWITLDMMQGILDGFGNQDGKSTEGLFFTRDGQPRTLNIPTERLTHVMRSTEHIMQLNNEVRESIGNSFPLSSALPPAEIGHKVTSCVPAYHKLQYGADDQHVLPFIISRLRQELEAVTAKPFSLPLSNVAVLYDDDSVLQQHKCAIASFLNKEFATTPQTIEEQLINNNTADIVLDADQHIMSFEIPVVIHIQSYGGDEMHYKIGTRARVSLTIVDVNIQCPPSVFKRLDVVLWKPVIIMDS